MSDAPLADDEIESWYAGKSFSSDWTTWHFANWTTVPRTAARRTFARA